MCVWQAVRQPSPNGRQLIKMERLSIWRELLLHAYANQGNMYIYIYFQDLPTVENGGSDWVERVSFGSSKIRWRSLVDNWRSSLVQEWMNWIIKLFCFFKILLAMVHEPANATWCTDRSQITSDRGCLTIETRLVVNRRHDCPYWFAWFGTLLTLASFNRKCGRRWV